MKFLKTGKGKVVAILTAILLVSTAGVAFASSGAGGMLQKWYDGVFETSADEFDEEAHAYQDEMVAGFDDYYVERKESTGALIDRESGSATEGSIKNINEAKDDHIDGIEGTKEEILSGMEQDFYNVYMKTWLEIEQLNKEANAFVEEDMVNFATNVGEDAIEQLTLDINQAKDDAVSDLEDAIEKAKKDLSNAMNEKRESITKNINGIIDGNISRLEITVNEVLYKLSKEQQELIKQAAANLETEAKDALDDVVNNMAN